MSFDSGTPFEGTHFTVDYQTDSTKPSVTLKAGSLSWKVRSDDGGSPGKIGTISLNPNVGTDDFGVSVMNGANPGATDIGAIHLDAGGGWTGTADLNGLLISGSLTGELTVQNEVKGAVLISGSVVGPLTVAKVTGFLNIVGDYGDSSANHTFDIDEISGGGIVYIQDDVLNSASGTLTVTVDTIGDGSTVGTFKIFDDVSSSNVTITIGDLGDDTSAGGVSGFEIGGDLGGTLVLTEGVPSTEDPGSTNFVTVNTLTSTGIIDLTNDPVQGTLFITNSAESGSEIRNGGAIQGSVYPAENNGDFAGTATFDSIAAGGNLWCFDPSGAIKECAVTGTINITNDVDGLIRVDGNMSGTLDIGGDVGPHSGDDGLVWIVETMSGTVQVDGSVDGHIHFPKTFASPGAVTIDGSLNGSGGVFKLGDNISSETHTGDLTVKTDMNGLVDVDGDYDGDMIVQGDAGGDFDFEADLSGTLTIDGILDNGSDLAVGESLTSTAEITIKDDCEGDIIVGTSTASGSVIHLEGGLQSTGTVTINEDEGDHDAGGTIAVGSLSGDPIAGDYDGSITVKDNSASGCSGSYGDLDGVVRIAVCDDNDAADHTVCVEGDVNGSISVVGGGVCSASPKSAVCFGCQ